MRRVPKGAFVVSDHYTTNMELSPPAPNLPPCVTRVAPFSKSAKKRAATSAKYLSECYLHAVPPVEAESAALDAQSRYEKWWVDSSYKDKGETEHHTKKRRIGCAVTSSKDVATATATIPATAVAAKEALLEDLKRSGGETTSPKFTACLEVLQAYYHSKGFDARWLGDEAPSFPVEGKWLTLSKPTFSDCLGPNEKGKLRYTLGRMSFDMFRPTHLKCSINHSFNSISPLPDASDRSLSFSRGPRKLRAESHLARTYE
jgi:hypothetical protein